jgi:sporulation protein ytfJ
MADKDNAIISSIETMFKGLDGLMSAKTVVGEPTKIEDTIIVPLVDVSCGVAAGAFYDNSKNNGGGGMSAKLSPSAVLIIQNGVTKLVNVKSQDAITKILDMVPDIVNKFSADKEISKETVEKAKEIS